MSNILPNTDPETGIRYGVIPFNDLFNCAEEFFDNSNDLTHADYIQEAKDKLKQAILGVVEDYGIDEQDAKFAAAKAFDSLEQNFNDKYEPDCPRLQYTKDGYVIDRLDETDLFVAKSPYFTFAPECSPCAPNACYLRSAINDGSPVVSLNCIITFKNHNGREHRKCYCLGHDWYEDNQAPYVVYDIKTGLEVHPEQIQ